MECIFLKEAKILGRSRGACLSINGSKSGSMSVRAWNIRSSDSSSNRSRRSLGDSRVEEVDETAVKDFAGRTTKALLREVEGSVFTRAGFFLGAADEMDEVTDGDGAFLRFPAIGRGSRSLVAAGFGAIERERKMVRENGK